MRKIMVSTNTPTDPKFARIYRELSDSFSICIDNEVKCEVTWEDLMDEAGNDMREKFESCLYRKLKELKYRKRKIYIDENMKGFFEGDILF